MKCKIKKSTKSLIIFLVVYLVVSVGVAVYYYNAMGRDRIIKNGFDEPLSTMLRDEYSVTIPDDAEFIKGKHSGFQDHCITLFFKIPANGKDVSEVVGSLLDQKIWPVSIYAHAEAKLESYSEMAMEYSQISKGKAHASIKHTDVKDDGYVYVVFSGWRPSMKGVDTKIDW